MDDMEKRFTYHPPKPGQPEIYEELRVRAPSATPSIDEGFQRLDMLINENEELVYRVIEILSAPRLRGEGNQSVDEGRYPTMPSVLDVLADKMARRNETLYSLIQELQTRVGSIKILG